MVTRCSVLHDKTREKQCIFFFPLAARAGKNKYTKSLVYEGIQLLNSNI